MPEPSLETDPGTASTPPSPAPDQSRPVISDATLVIPSGVALLLDTALHGDRAAAGTPDAEGRPRAKNLAILVGTIRTATAGSGRRARARTTRTPFGTYDHAYFLTVNEVVGNEQGAARTSFRLPIAMTEAVCARYRDLLVDGQRVAVVGPLNLEERYDGRFRRDAYDAGRPVWDIRLDVLAVQEVSDTLPDMGIVQYEGEVADVARYVSRPAGPRGLRESYALVYLRARRLLPTPYGHIPRPVVTTLPVEVLVDPDTDIIPHSDALLRVGNSVRIEGHLGVRIQRLNSADDDVRDALDQVANRMTERNTTLSEHEQTIRERNRQRPKGQRESLDGPRALDQAALERRIYRAQQAILNEQRLRIEVGLVELLHGTPLSPEDRATQIRAGLARRRRSPAPATQTEQPVLTPGEREDALDQATVAAMMDRLETDADNAPAHSDESPATRRPVRRRVRQPPTPDTDTPTDESPSDDEPEHSDPQPDTPPTTGPLAL